MFGFKTETNKKGRKRARKKHGLKQTYTLTKLVKLERSTIRQQTKYERKERKKKRKENIMYNT